MSRGSAGIAKSAIGVLGIALAVAAIGGVSVAQPQPQPQAGQGPPPAAAAPAAGAAAAPAAAPAAGSIDKGRDIFANYGCGTCHTLNDAGATGHVGPAFDGNSNLSQDFIVDRVTNGQGMMPSFAGQLSADEINSVAAYIMKTKAN